MKPRKKDILELKDWDREQFASWLRIGLEEYFIRREGIRHFRPFEYCMLHEHTLWGDLVNIYEAFSSKQQKAIREAVVFLMFTLPVNQGYVRIFDELRTFSEAIGAPSGFFKKIT